MSNVPRLVSLALGSASVSAPGAVIGDTVMPEGPAARNGTGLRRDSSYGDIPGIEMPGAPGSTGEFVGGPADGPNHGSVKEGDPGYAGLIIDCRGLSCRRLMSPRIFDEEGKLVYTGTDASVRFVINTGVVKYYRDYDESFAATGGEPFLSVIKGLRLLKDQHRGHIIISDADAVRIRTEDAKSGFLKRYVVFFLLDSE